MKKLAPFCIPLQRVLSFLHGLLLNFKGTLSFYTLVSKAIIGRVILPNSIGMKVTFSWSRFQIARQAASINSLQVN